MRAGQLRHRIVLQSKTASRDAMGGDIITWSDRDTVWAAVEPLRGREYFSAHEFQSETEIRFRIRYRPDITTAWRAMWETRPYDITAVIDVNGKHVEQELMAKTQVNG